MILNTRITEESGHKVLDIIVDSFKFSNDDIIFISKLLETVSEAYIYNNKYRLHFYENIVNLEEIENDKIQL